MRILRRKKAIIPSRIQEAFSESGPWGMVGVEKQSNPLNAKNEKVVLIKTDQLNSVQDIALPVIVIVDGNEKVKTFAVFFIFNLSNLIEIDSLPDVLSRQSVVL